MAPKSKPKEPAATPRSAWLKRGLIVVGALVLLGGGAFVGVAWYYADQIESGAFRVDNSPPDLDLKVERIENREVTLRRVTGDARLDEPGVLGLESARGYAQIGDVREFDGDLVVRRFEPIDGAIATGDEVRFDRSAFPGDPRRAHGLEYQEIRIPAKIGDLPAWYVEGRGDVWAILVHGRTARRTEALRALKTVSDAGMPALVVSYRNDGEVPTDPSGRYQFGLTEWQDLEAAVKYALGKGAGSVVLIGYSMGGAIIANFMYESKVSDEVAGLVLDSPMLDLGQTVDLAARERNLPQVLASAAKRIATWRYGVDWTALNYLARVDELEAPVLLFHGDRDRTVPISISDHFARERRDIVTYVRVPGADHVASWNVDPVRYEKALLEFFKKVTISPKVVSS
jgi:alpha-beta hydrolase superfamily lysophospholipase